MIEQTYENKMIDRKELEKELLESFKKDGVPEFKQNSDKVLTIKVDEEEKED
jgi:hypothetical protein